MKLSFPRSAQALRSRRGVTLVELLVSLAAILAIAGSIAPALAALRGDGHAAQSAANLMQLGQGRDQYALDHKDRIYTYTWRAGESYMMPNGQLITPLSDSDAAARQNQEILMRRSGRITGPTKILSFAGRIPHRRYVHLTLMDYMAGDDDDAFMTPVIVDPADADQLHRQQQPLDYLEPDIGNLPYSEGIPSSFGYDSDGQWSQSYIAQRWTFGTSYQSVPYAWQGDGPDNVYAPISNTPHLYFARGVPDISGRYTTQVAFPSKKVHLHEDFDYEQDRFPWFAYNHSRPEKLMFDGSINSQRSGDANSSVNPGQPGQTWRQRYVPLHTFPIPITGLGESQELNMRYRWTDGGLQGVDYD